MDEEFQISNDFDQNYYGYHDNQPVSTTTNISISAVISASCVVMDDCYHSYSTAPDFQTTSEQFQYSPTNQTPWVGPELEHAQINSQNNLSCSRQNLDCRLHPSQIASQTPNFDRAHFDCPFFDDSDAHVEYGRPTEAELNDRRFNSNEFEDEYFDEGCHDSGVGSRRPHFVENGNDPRHERVVGLGRWEIETPGPCSVLCSRTEIQTDDFQEPYYSPEISNTTDLLQTAITSPADNEEEENEQSNDSAKKIEVDVDYMLSNGVTVAGYKPRPIIKKKKKRAVIQDDKDMNYWNRRSKNNDSARRSRETKKEKERLFYKQALQYEYENYFLKERILQLESQLGIISTRDNPPNISQF